MAQYNDLHSSENIDKLRSEIYSISTIMSENIEMILDRDKTIQKMGKTAQNLKLGSKKVLEFVLLYQLYS